MNATAPKGSNVAQSATTIRIVRATLTSVGHHSCRCASIPRNYRPDSWETGSLRRGNKRWRLRSGSAVPQGEKSEGLLSSSHYSWLSLRMRFPLPECSPAIDCEAGDSRWFRDPSNGDAVRLSEPVTAYGACVLPE